MRITLGLIIVTALSAACAEPAGTGSAGGLDRQTFMTVMQELQLAPPAQRDAIMQKHGTSAAGIEAFLRQLSEDPVALAAVLDTIAVRVERSRIMDARPAVPKPPE
jgi:hypothetical protein